MKRRILFTLLSLAALAALVWLLFPPANRLNPFTKAKPSTNGWPATLLPPGGVQARIQVPI